MAAFMTQYLRNKITDWWWRGQTFTPPSTHYIGLLKSTKGPRANSTAYALADTVSVVANDAIVHLYSCTTAGTTAAAQGTLYPGAADEVITDGTAVFTEQKTALRTAVTEVSGGGYTRMGVAASLTAWAGTQGATTAAASSGTSGTTCNNAAVVFPAPTADWKYIWAACDFDASTAGNALTIHPLTAPVTVSSGDLQPGFAISGLQFTWDK